MREWLERVIPNSSWHVWAVDAGNAAWMIGWALILFLLARWLALRALAAVLTPLLRRADRDSELTAGRLRTLGSLAASSITYVLLFVAIITLLGELGINIATLVAGAGVAGLALSFGAQRLVRDVLTGFFLLLEDQFRVGEVVTIIASAGLPQLNGTILEMGLRATRLTDITGKLVTIGNGDIAAVVNHSRGPVTATVDVGVAPETALTQLSEVVSSAPLPESLLAGAAAVQGVAAIEASRIVYRITAPAQPGKAPDAELALRQEIAEALRRAEIEIK